MNIAEKVFRKLKEKQLTLVTAESCTGGMIASALTDIAGSSAVFDRGFVTYSNAAKMDMLGVPEETLEQYGAVSVEVAQAMAQGAIDNSYADIAVSVTGIAGPTGGSTEKPVGLVIFGILQKGAIPQTHIKNFTGDRNAIRTQSRDYALQLILELLS
jgi:nicotinamide-nucleotide amidase